MDTEQYRSVRDSIRNKTRQVAAIHTNTDHNGRPTQPLPPIDTSPQQTPPAAEQAPPAWATGTAAARAHLVMGIGEYLDDPFDIVDDLDLDHYLNDDGTVNTAAIEATTTKYQAIASQTPTPATPPPPPPNLGQGNVGEPEALQLTAADMFTVKAEHVRRQALDLPKMTDAEIIRQMRNR